MSNHRIADVLYDSETMLRLVDSELDELREDARDVGIDCGPVSVGNHVGVLLAVMQRASAEIAQVLCTLHTSREALEGLTMAEIHESAMKVCEVSTATEIAANRMMDGLERIHSFVDRLDALDAPDDTEDAVTESAAVRASIRDELFAVMGSLQFQDITSQQLGHVSQMLRHAESRLHATSALLSGGHADAATLPTESGPTFSESASTQNSFERQAAADAIFWRCAPNRIAQ